MINIQSISNVAKNAQEIKVTARGITEILTLKELEWTLKLVEILIVELTFEHHKIIFDCDTHTIGTRVFAS